MSFWNLSDGEDASKSADGDYEIPSFGEPIPDNTNAHGMPAEAKWVEWDGNEYINIQWQVVQPDEIANRRVFQKLWVTDDDPQAKDPSKKRDKAKLMLANIYANAGVKMPDRKPTDSDLAKICNKVMGLKVMLWEMDNGNRGNWIAAVWPKGGKDLSSFAGKPTSAPKTTTPASGAGDLNDEIPF
jgi:hypothetical protein